MSGGRWPGVVSSLQRAECPNAGADTPNRARGLCRSDPFRVLWIARRATGVAEVENHLAVDPDAGIGDEVGAAMLRQARVEMPRHGAQAPFRSASVRYVISRLTALVSGRRKVAALACGASATRKPMPPRSATARKASSSVSSSPT